MLKMLRPMLQQYMNHELPHVQAGFRKGKGTRDQIANICWIIKKAREFQKTIYFCFIDYTKVFEWITTNCGKFFKRWEYQTTWPASWEICIRIEKQQLEPNVEQWTGSKIGKGVCQDCILSPCLFIFYAEYIIQNAWMKHKLESTLLGEILITSDIQMIPPLWQKAKQQRASWWRWKRRVKKLA